MQAAFHRDQQQLIYAALEHDFHYRFIHLPKRPDGTSQLECVDCKADVFAQGGREGGKQRGHFKHHSGGCPYGHATQSEAHRRLKAFVATCVESHDGWEAGLEVARHGWRADVLATCRWAIDPDAVFARAGQAEREIVFEIQHTAQSPAVTRQRSQPYLDAGCEVVWLFDHPSNHLGTPEPCVEVRGADGAYRVAGGIWSPSPHSKRPPTSLSSFVTSLLDRDIEYRTVPTVRRQRWEAPPAPKMAWVHLRDDNELQHQLSIEKRRDDRDRATTQVIARLTAAGWPPDPPHYEYVGAAYATLVDSRDGHIAVHPYPKNVNHDQAKVLSSMSAVIARNAGELRQLAAKPITSPILLLEDFAPAKAPTVAPQLTLPAPPPPPFSPPPASPPPLATPGPHPEDTRPRPTAPPPPTRRWRLPDWVTRRRRQRRDQRTPRRRRQR